MMIMIIVVIVTHEYLGISFVNMVDPKPPSCAHSVRRFKRAPGDQIGTVAGVWWKKGKRSEGSFEGDL